MPRRFRPSLLRQFISEDFRRTLQTLGSIASRCSGKWAPSPTLTLTLPLWEGSKTGPGGRRKSSLSKHFTVLSSEAVNISKLANLIENTKNYGQITLNIKLHVDPLSSTSKSALWGSYFDFHYTCLLYRDWRHVSSIILKWPKAPRHVSFTELALFSAYKIHNIKVIRGTESSLRNVEVFVL